MGVHRMDGSWVTIEPLRLARHEPRGPRMYTVQVAAPGGRVPLPRGIGNSAAIGAVNNAVK